MPMRVDIFFLLPVLQEGERTVRSEDGGSHSRARVREAGQGRGRGGQSTHRLGTRLPSHVGRKHHQVPTTDHPVIES